MRQPRKRTLPALPACLRRARCADGLWRPTPLRGAKDQDGGSGKGGNGGKGPPAAGERGGAGRVKDGCNGSIASAKGLASVRDLASCDFAGGLTGFRHCCDMGRVIAAGPRLVLGLGCGVCECAVNSTSTESSCCEPGLLSHGRWGCRMSAPRICSAVGRSSTALAKRESTKAASSFE